MRHRSWITIGAVAAALALGAQAVFGDRSRPSQDGRRVAADEDAAAPREGVRELLYAQPFRLSEPYAFEWTAERVLVTSGWLVVLQDDPAACRPSQEAEPVLYAGAVPVERVNTGIDGGRVVAVVPAFLDEAGEPRLDLAATEFYRGTPDFPERVTRAAGNAELAAARLRGVTPFDRAAVARVRQAELLDFPTRDELLRFGAGLVLEWAPAERELAESMLVPRVR